MKEKEDFRAQNKSRLCTGCLLQQFLYSSRKNANKVNAHESKIVEYTVVHAFSGTVCCHYEE